MTEREIKIVAEAKAAILAVEPEAEVLLFGSRARGEAHEESDFDLLVVTPERVGMKRRSAYSRPMVDLELAFNEMISLHFVQRSNWDKDRNSHPFLREVNREAYRP